MADLIVVAILVIVLATAIMYIIKAKKSGTKCIGCPAGGNCSGKNNGTSQCSCGCQSEEK